MVVHEESLAPEYDVNLPTDRSFPQIHRTRLAVMRVTSASIYTEVSWRIVIDRENPYHLCHNQPRRIENFPRKLAEGCPVADYKACS